MSRPVETGTSEGREGARPKVRPSQSEERRDEGRRKEQRGMKKNLNNGCHNGDLLDASSSSLLMLDSSESLFASRPFVLNDQGRVINYPSSGGRTLRQKIQDAVGQCFPIKSQSQSFSPSNTSSILSRQKIHISELMLDSCPFPVGSELAQKWHLIKQHTVSIIQIAEPPRLGGSAQEDEDDRLRERRRISIEQGVEPPPNVQIHTFEVTAQINPLYKLGPKLAHGMNELTGDERATLHQLLLQSCLNSLDEVPTASTSEPGFVPQDAPIEVQLDSPKSQEVQHRIHTQIDYIHCLVPDLLQVTNMPCYWGVMDRYQAETLLEGKPEGTFLLRDSAQEDYLFSVSFRRYGRSLHARIEQWNHNFSFDVHDPSVFHAPTVTGLLEHYKDPNSCMFFEPLLSNPIHRTQPFSLQHICRAVISSCTSYDGIGALSLPTILKEHLREYHYKQRVRVRRLDTCWE